MKAKSGSQFEYTEKEMGNAFFQLLRSPEGLPGIGTFDKAYREITCYQGRPDFIAYRIKEGVQPITVPESTGFVGPSILSMLKPKAPRTLNYLLTHSEFAEDSIKRSLQQLITFGYVERTPTGAYRLGSAAAQFQIELWCFELKLNNPKRAIFQAQQTRAYAEHAIIVVPMGQERNYIRYIEAIKRWNISLATFDPISGEFCLRHHVRRSRAYNRQYKIYAVSQLLLNQSNS